MRVCCKWKEWDVVGATGEDWDTGKKVRVSGRRGVRGERTTCGADCSDCYGDDECMY